MEFGKSAFFRGFHCGFWAEVESPFGSRGGGCMVTKGDICPASASTVLAFELGHADTSARNAVRAKHILKDERSIGSDSQADAVDPGAIRLCFDSLFS